MDNQKLTLPKTAVQKILRAIREFRLIDPGDRVLVGFSGGKDSAFLLYALSILKKHRIIPFELGALTIDLGFEGDFDFQSLSEFCQFLDVPFQIMKTEIVKYAFSESNPEGPCATCSFLRRGAMNRFAKNNNYNRVALAHHYDDAVETFLMSILYSGQIKTFLPRTDLQRTGLTSIRPLVYFRESEIIKMLPLIHFKPVPAPCGVAGHTQRAATKDLIRSLCQNNEAVFHHLASAMRTGKPQELWPAALEHDQIRKISKKEKPTVPKNP